MEKRIGAAIIIVNSHEQVGEMNHLLTQFGQIIMARQGVPLRDKGISVITLILDGNADSINALTGKLGRLEGIQVKTLFTKYC